WISSRSGKPLMTGTILTNAPPSSLARSRHHASVTFSSGTRPAFRGVERAPAAVISGRRVVLFRAFDGIGPAGEVVDDRLDFLAADFLGVRASLIDIDEFHLTLGNGWKTSERYGRVQPAPLGGVAEYMAGFPVYDLSTARRGAAEHVQLGRAPHIRADAVVVARGRLPIALERPHALGLPSLHGLVLVHVALVSLPCAGQLVVLQQRLFD